MEQLSIYTENKKGSMKKILSHLTKEEINILCFVCGDSGEYGTIRFIVSDSEKAISVLENAGYQCKVSKVIGVAISDHPGSLEELMDVFQYMNVNIEYLYMGFIRESNSPIILLHCDYIDIACKTLEARGYTVY